MIKSLTDSDLQRISQFNASQGLKGELILKMRQFSKARAETKIKAQLERQEKPEEKANPPPGKAADFPA